ncbi:MAG: ABC-F family ATP-binding cassette domain-containing protein [Oscillospiraceae bacterium]|nr:ABC-F family ATP-binding cassette domain-containing protein [Oscillospiraceae bacterium]
MLITLNKVCLSFGSDVILQDITAQLDKQNRIGIIGENGAGKTTLLRILMGQLLPDSGEFSVQRGSTLGYLEQNGALNSALTVYQEMESAFSAVTAAMEELKAIEQQLVNHAEDAQLIERHSYLVAIIDAADGYNMDTQIKKILFGMGFPASTHSKEVRVLSGGERTRLLLAKLLLQNPDVLILDEPTNHLDFETLEWLENYLKGYSGAVLVVSHDRYFLDEVTNFIWELEDTHLISYRGNYSAYLPQKEMAVQLQQKQHDADVAKAAKLQDYVDRNLVRASTTKMAQSRRKQLEKMDITEKPKTSHTELKFQFEFDVAPYNEVLTIKALDVAIGGKTLIKQLNLQVLRGERLVIAGPNGAGKSTLLRVLAGRLKPLSGTIKLGSGVRPSFFEQQQTLRSSSVINAIWDKYPKFTELEVRNLLARFNFKGEDVFKEASKLSGGELARLRFAEILLERPNLMFLDEPTNHLDIYTRESLGNALACYEGTLLLVTHDRYLMNSLECPILYVEEDKTTLYESYQAMMQHQAAEVQNTISAAKAQAQPKPTAAPKELRRRKAELRNLIRDTEIEIEKLGADIVEMEALLGTDEVLKDHERLRQLCDDLDDTRFKQDELYTKWEQLVEENETLLEE